MLRRPSSPSPRSLLTLRARAMLASPSPSELLLWRHALSALQLGVSFRRQVPLAGHFIADFYASSCRLVVEVDGPSHLARSQADARRDRTLAKLGFHVLRIDAELVLRDLPRALALVRVAIARAQAQTGS